jgi:hypothetical protein
VKCYLFLCRTIWDLIMIVVSKKLTWIFSQVTNTAQNMTWTCSISVLAKYDHCCLTIWDSGAMEGMKCYFLLCRTIWELIIIVGCKKLTWIVFEVTNTTLNVTWTYMFSVLSKLNHCCLTLWDWRDMEAMQCHYLICQPIWDVYIIFSCKQIDLTGLRSDQHSTKCLWNLTCTVL